MSSSTHTGTITIAADPGGGNPVTYNFSGILRNTGRYVEGGFQFENNGPIFQLTFKITNAAEPLALERVTVSLFLPTGGTALFTNAAPQSATYNTVTQSLEVDALTCTIDGDQFSFVLGIALIQAEDEAAVQNAAAAGAIVDEIEVTPEILRTNQILSHFDNFGHYSGTERLPGELNFDFKDRIEDGIFNRGGASLRELLTAIGRDLGIIYQPGIRVLLRSEIDHAASQVVKFIISDGRLRIYSKWLARQSRHLYESEIETLANGFRFDLRLRDYTLGQIVDIINTSSLYEATLSGPISGSARGLETFSSIEHVEERIQLQDIGRFSHQHLQDASFATTDIDIFKQQQPVVDGEPISEHLVLPGDYAIDYETGRYAIKGYSGFSSTIHYAAIHREFKIRTNKVDLIQLHSEAAQDSLFNQVENNVYISEEERFTNGLPTDELFEILQTLLNTGSYLQYWGE